MGDHNPLAAQSDSDIVRNAFSSGATQGAFGVEMMRRLKDSLDRQTDSLLASQRTTNDLTTKIRTLTVWLVILTIVITALTVVMAWPTLALWFPKGSGR